jgi:hypothetical protein
MLLPQLLLAPMQLLAPVAPETMQWAAVRAGRLTLNLQSGSIGSIEVAAPSGPRTYKLLPGSGTTLEGCVASSSAVSAADGAAGGATLTRTFTCEPNEYHNVPRATATVVDTFRPTTSGTIRWEANISSTSAAAWGTAVSSVLGYADWANETRAWVGGPYSGGAPGLSYDPFAGFDIAKVKSTGLAQNSQVDPAV